ncbi:MAG: tRNA (guanosine(46)-N7)-methyltransferase TrmB [Proteobacteria bacterium]|nr:tRNA (guanosine(46)-N7)-methyltransferase TrmB [Pseudomonadota bacterium]
MDNFSPKVFGRRHSRPLKVEKKSLYETSLPTLKAPLNGDFYKNIEKALHLEIGFGGGEHLAKRAKESPEIQFIGAEPFINGVASLLKHIHDHNIQNILVHDDDINILFDCFDTQIIFDRIYLLFADPWPKKRHYKRRFVQAKSIALVHKLLKENGEWYIATDHEDYRSWILEHFKNHENLFIQTRDDIFERPSVESWPITRYEQKAIKEGRKSSYMIYKKIG